MSSRKLFTSTLRRLPRPKFTLSTSPLSSLESLNCRPNLLSNLSHYQAGVYVGLNCLLRQSLDHSVSSRHFCSEPSPYRIERCWNCGAAAQPTPFLACGSCRSVQPVDPSIDYFQIFGLEKRYDVLTENLESKYKDWQKKLHPDLVHSKSEKEKAYAVEQSARVIDAYRTLSKPLLRALYLMKLEGVPLDEENTIKDLEILAEMMELREAIEEATDSQALKQIQTQIEQKQGSWCKSFGIAFENREFEGATTSIQRMRYYERAIEEIIKKL